MNTIINKINTIGAAAITLLSAALGKYWYLFAAFLVLEVVDYITGIWKAKETSTENSNKGAKGIMKKVGYWVVIGIAFFVASTFADMGAQVGIDLSWTALFGWFTLATFIINEIRSVLENLVLIGVNVPEWLTRGLEVASHALDNEMKEGEK